MTGHELLLLFSNAEEQAERIFQSMLAGIAAGLETELLTVNTSYKMDYFLLISERRSTLC